MDAVDPVLTWKTFPDEKFILDKTFFPNADILQGRYIWLMGNKVKYLFIFG
jgi:hypothetical protein